MVSRFLFLQHQAEQIESLRLFIIFEVQAELLQFEIVSALP